MAQLLEQLELPPLKGKPVAECGVRYRLVRAFLGTVAVTLGMFLVAFHSPYFIQFGFAWSMAAMAGQMLLGALVLAKGLEQYEKASFPPGSQALQNPVACWIQAKLEYLKKLFWPLWFLAILLLMFTPILTAVFLPLVLWRPFYATVNSSGPYFEVFCREIKQTARYLYEMGKGLLILTLCCCLALGSSLVVLVAAIMVHYHPL